MYFDRGMLEADMRSHAQWREEAENVLALLEEDEVALQQGGELREQFDQVKANMAKLPLYDKEISQRMQVFDWLFSSSDMLSRQSFTKKHAESAHDKEGP